MYCLGWNNFLRKRMWQGKLAWSLHLNRIRALLHQLRHRVSHLADLLVLRQLSPMQELELGGEETDR